MPWVFQKHPEHAWGLRNTLSIPDGSCWVGQHAEPSGRPAGQALNKKSGYFTELDQQTLELFSVHLGNSLTMARLHVAAL